MPRIQERPPEVSGQLTLPLGWVCLGGDRTPTLQIATPQGTWLSILTILLDLATGAKFRKRLKKENERMMDKDAGSLSICRVSTSH